MNGFPNPRMRHVLWAEETPKEQPANHNSTYNLLMDEHNPTSLHYGWLALEDVWIQISH